MEGRETILEQAEKLRWLSARAAAGRAFSAAVAAVGLGLALGALAFAPSTWSAVPWLGQALVAGVFARLFHRQRQHVLVRAKQAERMAQEEP